MATVHFGNTSVIETVKRDETLDANPDNTVPVPRPDLGHQITTMTLLETDIADRASTAMNMQMAVRLWPMHSDKDPAWVESNERLLAELLSDHYGCPIGRPKTWRRG